MIPMPRVTERNTDRNPRSRDIARQCLRYLGESGDALGLRPLGPLFPATPSGASASHLVGGLPMSSAPEPGQCTPAGRLSGAERVYIVDGAVIPELPAQNATFTLMANAHRIACSFAEQVGS